MIRCSEAVLNGHPDRFCDLVADRIIEEAYRYDEQAYGQVEVAVWSDRVWASGGIATRAPFSTDILDMIHEVGRKVGYRDGNHIDVSRYVLDNHICFVEGDPRQWTEHVNDQSIVTGWAGYDEKTRYLPPEHFLAHRFREALVTAMNGGLLVGEGPDGKLLVRVREEGSRWHLEHILVTIQQRASTSLLDIGAALAAVLETAYRGCRGLDGRWTAKWEQVELLVNPNGPLVEGGSDGDNGQTGRKLAVDFYGPRVPIGGGALSGKDLTHIDRAGAYAARHAALDVVSRGARECLVTVVYAPNRNEPLDVRFDIDGSVRPPPARRFHHDRVRCAWEGFRTTARLGQGTHFYDPDLPWNRPAA
jgi:S-adenosylmethionine synthetase